MEVDQQPTESESNLLGTVESRVAVVPQKKTTRLQRHRNCPTRRKTAGHLRSHRHEARASALLPQSASYLCQTCKVSPTRVLHVIARMNVGGTARYLETLANGLNSYGFESLVATGHVQGEEAEDPCVQEMAIARIPHMGRRIAPVDDWKARRELSNLIKSFQPDIIHSHTFKAGLIARSIHTTIPRVHTFHGHLLTDPEFQGCKKRFVIVAERTMATQTQRLITVGEKVRDELLEVKVGRPEQYISIPPGVKPMELVPRELAREQLGITEESRPIVVWMARVTGVKRPDRLMNVAAAIPQARFLMAGGGDLLEWAKINAPDNVTVLGWADAAVLWSAADVGLTTSDNEGMPVALIEAQFAGVPIVGTDVGSVSEVVISGATGLVTGPEPSDLTRALATMITDQEFLVKCQVQAKNHAAEHFSVSGNLRAHNNLYQVLAYQRSHGG